MNIRLKYKGIALISSTLFFIYSQIAFGLYKMEMLPEFMPTYDNMVYHSIALILGMWSCVGRYEFKDTKLVKPINICFHVTISYCSAELTGIAQGNFSIFGLWMFCFYLIVLVFLTLQRERIKWNTNLKKHKYLYLFCGWMLTF